MTKTVIGADRLRLRLSRLKKTVGEETAIANRKNGENLIRLAKILHPGDGSTKAEISGRIVVDTEGDPTGYLVDFGSKSKVTEGSRGPRPYVNPALKVARKANRARVRRAINKAVKRAFNG